MVEVLHWQRCPSHEENEAEIFITAFSAERRNL